MKGKNFSFDSSSGTEKGTKVENTKMLEPGAREASIYKEGNDNQNLDKPKHPAFGKLGAKGFAEGS